ncbi:MAG: hypothetical protein ACOX7F_02780 [Eubacteriales bacterium]
MLHSRLVNSYTYTDKTEHTISIDVPKGYSVTSMTSDDESTQYATVSIAENKQTITLTPKADGTIVFTGVLQNDSTKKTAEFKITVKTTADAVADAAAQEAVDDALASLKLNDSETYTGSAQAQTAIAQSEIAKLISEGFTVTATLDAETYATVNTEEEIKTNGIVITTVSTGEAKLTVTVSKDGKTATKDVTINVTVE